MLSMHMRQIILTHMLDNYRAWKHPKPYSSSRSIQLAKDLFFRWRNYYRKHAWS